MHLKIIPLIYKIFIIPVILILDFIGIMRHPKPIKYYWLMDSREQYFNRINQQNHLITKDSLISYKTGQVISIKINLTIFENY